MLQDTVMLTVNYLDSSEGFEEIDEVIKCFEELSKQQE